jgi:hypothetical protein
LGGRGVTRVRRFGLVGSVVGVVREPVALGRVDQQPAELVGVLSDGPREVDVPVVADVVHLDGDLVADLPVETLQAAVEFAPVQESGHRADIDEDTEVGVPVDRATVVSPRRELRGIVAFELEYDVLLMDITDRSTGGGTTDDTVTHYCQRTGRA